MGLTRPITPWAHADPRAHQFFSNAFKFQQNHKTAKMVSELDTRSRKPQFDSGNSFPFNHPTIKPWQKGPNNPYRKLRTTFEKHRLPTGSRGTFPKPKSHQSNIVNDRGLSRLIHHLENFSRLPRATCYPFRLVFFFAVTWLSKTACLAQALDAVLTDLQHSNRVDIEEFYKLHCRCCAFATWPHIPFLKLLHK